MNHHWSYALGCALIALLWQGSLVALLLVVVRTRLQSSTSRYLSSLLALFSFPAIFAATFEHFLTAPPASSLLPISFLLGSQWMPWLVAFWMAGVLAMAVYTIGGWFVLARIRRSVVIPAQLCQGWFDEEWNQWFQTLCLRMKVGATVRLEALADHVSGPRGLCGGSPMVVGWLRPVILIPAALLAGIQPELLEALLLHELAHIRRRDYLVNLIQRAVEVIFFYHPGVWWISKHVVQEREHCCDDAAVAACGDHVAYARALVELEARRRILPVNLSQTVVAANGGRLRLRVERVLRLAPSGGGMNLMRFAMTSALAVLLVASGAVVAPSGHRSDRSTGLAPATIEEIVKGSPALQIAPPQYIKATFRIQETPAAKRTATRPAIRTQRPPKLSSESAAQKIILPSIVPAESQSVALGPAMEIDAFLPPRTIALAEPARYQVVEFSNPYTAEQVYFVWRFGGDGSEQLFVVQTMALTPAEVIRMLSL